MGDHPEKSSLKCVRKIKPYGTWFTKDGHIARANNIVIGQAVTISIRADLVHELCVTCGSTPQVLRTGATSRVLFQGIHGIM